MTVIQIVLGVAFAVLAVGALGLIALFFACDRVALYEKSKHENEKNH